MIIKCPECGHEVSDKAPTCPSCGVEIAGKVTACKYCGEVILASETVCPYCKRNLNAENPQHQNSTPLNPTPTSSKPISSKPISSTPTSSTPLNSTSTSSKPQPRKSRVTLIVSFFLALTIFGILMFFYTQAQRDREAEDYEFAMTSADVEILKNYLLQYPDAPEAHRDSITAHLTQLQKGDEEWQNAISSNSRTMLRKYIEENPHSLHIQEAMIKIDSLDWIAAQKANTEEAVKEYLEVHPDGRYYDEASIMLTEIEKTKVQPSEETMVTSLFTQFFDGVNMHDEETLVSTVSMVMSTFLGKSNATANDVVTCLHKLYKGDVDNLEWKIDTQTYKISKSTNANGEQDYSVSFYAYEKVQRNTTIENIKYRINANVTTDGRISGFEMVKINE